MSDEKPFCRVSDPFDTLRPLWFGKANPTIGVPASPPGYELIVCAINNQESARERKAVAKALRDYVKWMEARVTISKSEALDEGRARADALEKD